MRSCYAAASAVAAAHRTHPFLQLPQPNPSLVRRPAPVVAMPRIELPAGVTDITATGEDHAMSAAVDGWDEDAAIRRARELLRQARREQRRGASRPATKRAKGRRELEQARTSLVTASIACGVAELCRHRLTATPERIARIRERSEAQMDREPGAFAITVENWIRDLAGDERLHRG